MDINKYVSKNTLIFICIIIVILIILRLLYSNIYSNLNSNVEGFSTSDKLITDILTKYKSTNAQDISNPNNSNKEMQIASWSNKIYNMQNITQQSKAIAFYKPILTNNNETYCKLGDIVSQNSDYSLPNSEQFTLLVKKNTSDIKLPSRYDLVVDITYDKFNNMNYEYDKYINNNFNISDVKDNLLNCASAITNLNTFIQNNLSVIQNKFTNEILNNNNITVGTNVMSIFRFLNSGPTIEGFDGGIEPPEIIFQDSTGATGTMEFTDLLGDIRAEFDELNNPQITPQSSSQSSLKSFVIENVTKDTELMLPAGIQGTVAIYSNGTFNKTIDISIPSNIDNSQIRDNKLILNKLPLIPYNAMTESNIRDFPTLFPYPIFQFISSKDIINYIIELCTDMKTIYSNQKNNTQLLTYLKLAPSSETVDKVLTLMNSLLITADTINISDIITQLSAQNVNVNSTSTLLELVLNIMRNMNITYKLTYLNFKLSDIGVTAGSSNDKTTARVIISNFSNDFMSNIPTTKYNILSNPTFNTSINNLIPNITNFTGFVKDFSSNSLPLMPLQIYKPIAPDNYTSLGHIFCNNKDELKKIIESENVACVPSHCVKEIRDWQKTDKIFEYNKDNKYFAIYYNPYIGTFISTNSQQLPSGKVSKVVACVAKCTAVDKLKKSDECARQYYNLNKEVSNKVKLSSTLSSDQEEIFYLDKIKAQSDSISRLNSRAQKMQLDIDKASIVNREMNQNKLQDYVDTQKRNIDIIMKRLQADKNKIQTNINMPLDTLNNIMDMIKNSSALSINQKKELVQKLITVSNNKIITEDEYNSKLNNILSSCPSNDLTGLVKKTLASDVCYGCDIPK